MIQLILTSTGLPLSFTERFLGQMWKSVGAERQDGGRRKRPHPSSHPPPPLRETGFSGPLRKNLPVWSAPLPLHQYRI